MKALTQIFYLVLIMIVLTSACKKDEDETSSVANPAIPILLDSFPLAIGNSWKYFTEIELADSLGVVYETHYYDSYWTVISDTIINSISCFKISQLDSNYDGTTHQAYTYYTNKPDGFYGVAVENMGSMFFLRSKFDNYINTGSGIQFPKFTGVDTLFIPDSSLWFLKFPSTLNDTWHTLKYGTTGSFYQSRIYESYQTVTTSAGAFNCIKLKVFFESNGQPDTTVIDIYQYFSHKGLIKETQSGDLLFGNGGTAMLNRTTNLVQVNF